MYTRTEKKLEGLQLEEQEGDKKEKWTQSVSSLLICLGGKISEFMDKLSRHYLACSLIFYYLLKVGEKSIEIIHLGFVINGKYFAALCIPNSQSKERFIIP